MPSIDYTSPVSPSVNLGVRNWTDDFKNHANGVTWATIREGKTNVASGRIIEVAPRAGAAKLVKTPAGLGPKPAVSAAGGLSCADFTNNELNGLYCPTLVPRDSCGAVTIVELGTVAQAQNRDLIGFYGSGDALRVWRTPAGVWSWRGGSTEAAAITRPWAAGFLMVIAERIGSTVRLRLRDKAGTTEVATGAITTASVAVNVNVILGQDEMSDGHPQAAPNASRAWSENVMEHAVYKGAVLTDANVLGMWDAYFAAQYGSL